MASPGLCLSSAPILRCISLTLLQNQVIFIPAILEFIFSASLILIARRSSRKRFILVAEGCTYFLLCLLDLLSHTVPAVRDDLDVFRYVDITLGAVAGVPILLYISFIYIFAHSELVSILPSRFRNVFKALMMLSIPAIVALNGVASFVGISHQMIMRAGNIVLGIGFNNFNDKSLWTFFTSFTLALLTVYQALHFCLAFFRLTLAFINQRRIETTHSDEAHLFKGIIWICVGLKLGAIETVIGFAGGGFGGALSRRLLRFLSRAFLVVGIAKGVDNHEDFTQIQDEMKSNKQSGLRQLISNPRMSTFLHLSPTAAAFHKSRLPNSNGLPGMRNFADLKGHAFGDGLQSRRVTVHYPDSESAPTLHMRFSALDMPSPALIAESVKSRPASEWVTPTAVGSFHHIPLPSRSHLLEPYKITDVRGPAGVSMMPRRFSEPDSTGNRYSNVDSLNSLNAVRDLAEQFPGLPPRVTKRDLRRWGDGVKDLADNNRNARFRWGDPYGRRTTMDSGTGTTSSGSLSASSSLQRGNSLSRSNSLGRRKPAPPLDPQKEDEVNHAPPPPPTDHRRDFSAVTSQGTTPASALFTSTVSPARHSQGTTPGTGGPSYNDSYPVSAVVEADTIKFGHVAAASLASLYEGNEAMDQEEKQFVPSDRPLTDELHWLSNATGNIHGLNSINHHPSASLTRIKSVGKAPRRNTPAPVRHGLTRGSVYIEPILIPPRDPGIGAVELVQESFQSSALRDSEVLGMEEMVYVRR